VESQHARTLKTRKRVDDLLGIASASSGRLAAFESTLSFEGLEQNDAFSLQKSHCIMSDLGRMMVVPRRRPIRWNGIIGQGTRHYDEGGCREVQRPFPGDGSIVLNNARWSVTSPGHEKKKRIEEVA